MSTVPEFFASFEEDSEIEPFECAWIQVRRLESGRYVTAPKMWSAGELVDIAQLHEAYGGGQYELWARAGGQSGRQLITHKASVILPGTPKSLSGDAASAAAFAPATAAPVAPDLGSAFGPVGQLIAAAVPLVTLYLQHQGAVRAEERKEAREHQALILQLASSSRDTSMAMMQTLAGMTAKDKEVSSRLFEASLAHTGRSGQSELETYQKGIKDGLEQASQGSDSGGDLDTLATLAPLVQALIPSAQKAAPV